MTLSLTMWDKCFEAARRAGYTFVEASLCRDGELECLYCPFREGETAGALQQTDLEFPHGNWDDLC